MSALSNIAMGVSSIGEFASSGAQAQAERSQASFQKTVYDANARMADIKAEDSIRRGEKSAAQYGKKVSQTVGSQKAALAAQGVEIDTGSAAEIQAETNEVGALNAVQISNNAYREALGFKTEALSARTTGEFKALGGRAKAGKTILTGGLGFTRNITTLAGRVAEDA